MSFAAIHIEELLPHRGRMKLIEEILEINVHRAITRTTVSARWPLFRNDGVLALIGIELVAQTAGISNSWDGIQKYGKRFNNSGWLVGVKSAVFYLDTIGLNTRIITRADNEFEYEGFREILGTVETELKLIAKIKLQLLQSKGDGSR